jgi:hypothetical protein
LILSILPHLNIILQIQLSMIMFEWKWRAYIGVR